jgi:two-component system response regulator ResD
MNTRQTILVADDEATIAEVVRRYLELEGFQVILCRDGQEALEAFPRQPVHLALIDIMMPRVDGYMLVQLLRRQTPDQPLPIILLTSLSQENDRILGFELGVDDYIVKPFSPRELVARVKAVLKRSAGWQAEQTPRRLEFGALHIDPLRRLVTLANVPINLTLTEFNLLWFMARHPQQVLTREQLINQVWGYDFEGGENTLSVHIRRLREKIESDASQPRYIQTVRGIGYKFEQG